MQFRHFGNVNMGIKEKGTLSENHLMSFLLILAALALGPILLFLNYRHSFGGLVHPDAMDYAQLGRHLADGQGFTTSILRPLSLNYGTDPLHQPDVTHGPLYQFFLAIAIATFGTGDRVIVGVSSLFFLLTGLLMYRLGERLFDRTVGIISSLVFLCNIGNIHTALLGIPVPLYTFIMTGVFLFLYEIASHANDESKSSVPAPRGLLIFSGLFTGALYLANPLFIFVLPVIIGSIAFLCRRNRVTSLVTFCLSLLVMILPWLCRNAVLTGNPFLGQRGMELWMQTRDYPGYSAYRLTPDDIDTSMSLFRSVLQKITENFVRIIPGLVNSISGPLLVFLIPSFLFRFRNPGTNQIRNIMLAVTLSLLIVQVFIGLDLVFFVTIMPIFSILAAGFLIHLGKQAQLKHSSVLALASLFVLVVACPVLSDLMSPASTNTLPQSVIARSLKVRSKPDDVCLTDQPWLIAWYADRPALLIPSRTSKIESLGQKLGGIKWLFLTRDSRAMSPEWEQVYILFARWDVAYRSAQAANKPGPEFFQISGESSPILKGLPGLGPLPPSAEDVKQAKDGDPIDPPVAILAATATAREHSVRGTQTQPRSESRTKNR